MKTITKIFEDALKKNKDGGYDTLYVAVDVHGTIFKPTRRTVMMASDGANGRFEVVCKVGRGNEFDFYWFAKETLIYLSSKKNVKLILMTSAINQAEIVKKLESFGIKIYAINHNPDFAHNSSTQEIYADFTVKFYFDILLDDKAGFEPEHDWEELYKFLQKKASEDYERDLEEYRQEYIDGHREYFFNEEEAIDRAREYEMKAREQEEETDEHDL